MCIRDRDYIAAVRDIYLPLRFGATTAIIPKELFMSPERLFAYMNDKGVTAVGWSVSALTVPAALGAFECSVPQHLRKVCFSGSVMPCSCLRQWQLALPQARFVNQYGGERVYQLDAKELGLNDIKDSVSEYFNHLIFAPILNNVYMRALSAVTHKDYMTRRYMWKLEY